MFRDSIKKNKAAVVCLGDIGIFVLSLILTLYTRYGSRGFASAFRFHEGPFTVLLALWLFVFYAANLYNYTSWRTTLENGRRFIAALLTNFFLAIGIFYLFGNFFRLAPKLNLIIFTAIFGVLDMVWRYALARVLSRRGQQKVVAIFAVSPLKAEIIEHCREHPQLGYLAEDCATIEAVLSTIERYGEKTTAVVDSSLFKDPLVVNELYALLAEHIEIMTLAEFYEEAVGRIPLSEIGNEWFIHELKRDKSLYAFAKRFFDIVLAAAGMCVLSPVFIIVSILIPATSSGPSLYQQKRVGKDSRIFTLYKFRSMHRHAEKDGAVWSHKNDSRVTAIGAVLRRTHIDELPQLFNIIRGEMSFVGPRPERPEFTALLSKEIPHYAVRQTVLPGLTGWAQIEFRYANSVPDSNQKFEYDLYYIINRSLLLDAGIIVRTIRLLFIG